MKLIKKLLMLSTKIYDEPGIGKVFKNDIDYCEIIKEGFTLIVAFRGTENKKGWKSNFNFLDKNNNGIMDGFEDSFNALSNQILSYISDISEEVNEIICTGHSRGGVFAIQCINTLYKCRTFYNIPLDMRYSCITFGTPRRADKTQRNLFNRTSIWCTRVETPGDPVCDVPLRVQGYRKEGNILTLKTPWYWKLSALPILRIWQHHTKAYARAIEYTERN